MNRLKRASVVSLCALAAITATPSTSVASGHDDVPRSVISWTPASVEQQMFTGETATITVSFSSSKDVRRAAVAISPELAAFLHPQFMSIERLRRGQPRNLDLMFTVPADAQPSTVAGTIALARVEDDEGADSGDRTSVDGENRLLADALQVTLTIRRRATAAAEWSTSRHDAQRSGRSPHVGPIDRAIVQPLVPDPAGEPVIAPDHRVFLPIARGFELAAFNPDGSLSVDVAVPFLSTAVGASRAVPTKLTIAADGTVYAAVFGLDFPNTGGIFAFDPNGLLKWQHDTNGPVSTPAIGPDGSIYVTTQRQCDSRIIALRPDGSELWEYTYPDPGCRLGLSDVAVAPDGAVVVTVFGFSFVESHDPSTGALRWPINFGVTQSATAPAVAGDGTGAAIRPVSPGRARPNEPTSSS